MAIYRNVQLSFWTDNKVEDEFTPEDKYFYLYLLTNPQTNICGCYEVSYSQMTNQTGYNKDTINRLLDRFEKVHGVIRYCKETKEILILNWYRYNWSKSKDTLKGVSKVAEHIKCGEFRKYVFDTVNCIERGEITRPPIDPLQASITDTDTVSDSITDTDNKEIYKRIIDYLNVKCNTRYRHTTENTKKHIRARMAEGYSEDDFYIVIDKKCSEWIGTEQEKYLRPDTLFGTKFESYLNQRIIKCSEQGERDILSEWRNS